MKDRYILDTNVILQHPGVLAAAQGRRLIIPEAVMKELIVARVIAGREKLNEVIAQSTQRGVLIAKKPSEMLRNDVLLEASSFGLAGADIEIAALAIVYTQERGIDSTCVVTADRDLRRFLELKRIRSMSGREFLDSVKAADIDRELASGTGQVVVKQWKYLIFSFLSGILFSVVGYLVFKNHRVILETIPVWGTVFLVFILGVVLYWARQRFRLSYGIFEFLVGFITACRVLYPAFDYSQLSMAATLQILGGLYVMVRGLDNVGRSLKNSTFEKTWRLVFGET